MSDRFSSETLRSEKLSLARIYYPVRVLGPGSRVGIWLNGCDRGCPGCISPEMQAYDASREVTVPEIVGMISTIRGRIDGFTVSGGEPFYHPEALSALVTALAPICDDILIFTGFSLEELRNWNSSAVDNVLRTCAAIIDGPFVRALHRPRGLRGSENQQLRVFKYRERYAGLMEAERSLQPVLYDRGVLTIGIP